MNTHISIRLSDLRREKDISQKEAAAALGVSQALLSHYENGIRECGLDFLRKACDYYDVTADYLLGITENRHGLNDIYTKGVLQTDSELKIKTIYRTMVSLCEKLNSSGNAAENRLQSELMLSVYRFAILGAKYGLLDNSYFSIELNSAEKIASLLLDDLFSYKQQEEKPAQNAYEDEPIYLETIIDNTERFIREKCRELLSE